ncbi:type II secretion system protein [Noviherbaspirillum soli]|uniref:type II secretion system protein n=1 Tax=Noviherbaspirillum soli TaxID=1064518 RepID=UPI00188B765B|nr:prepilin-type N-terminal cleavage/methylation domain-containing protein [Noviherbaspirillum soli]
MGKAGSGYTLMELLVVLAIVALLLSVAAPRYFQSLDTARETILVENLARVRETIDRFHGDTGRYPESLEELVEQHYLRALPVDPVAESQTSWIVIAPEPSDKGAVKDIRSAAPGTARNGQAYSAL